jgi:serine protease Do
MGRTARSLRLLARHAMRVAVAAWSLQNLLAGASADLPLQPSAFVSVAAAVVRVEAQRQQGGISIGSGVTVAPSIVVTNCHVVRDALAIGISGGGAVWAVTGVSVDGVHDVCFLHVPSWNGRPVALGERSALRLGQSVAAIGFTGGAGKTMRFGRVQALHSLEGGRVVESDTPFTSGASGGGLFDAAGALVGLLTFRLRRGGGSYYSLPVAWIRDRLPGDGDWAEVRPLADALPFWQRDLDTLPYFMRAAPLYWEGRWGELVELTQRWSADEPREAEPLCVRGDAMQRLGRPEAAVAAYAEAVELGPDVPTAWYGLAFAYAVLGNAAGSGRAESRLADLDPVLATRLHEAVERLGSP